MVEKINLGCWFSKSYLGFGDRAFEAFTFFGAEALCGGEGFARVFGSAGSFVSATEKGEGVGPGWI